MKILIIEYQLIVAADLYVQLTKLNYEVIGFHANGTEAFRTIQNHRPDLILLSIGMNSSDDGLRLAERLDNTFGIPIVFLSFSKAFSTFQRVKALKPCSLIVKPFDRKSLARGMALAIERIGLQDAPYRHAIN